jgi:two-component system LytT family response regulator
MIKAYIIDDESSATEALIGKIKLFCPEVKIIGTSENYDQAILGLNEHCPEIIFLDIHLADRSGFDLVEAIHSDKSFENYKPEIIFITAHDEYAIRAIKISALDYLLKPIDPEELVSAIRKYQEKKGLKSNMDANFDILLDNLRMSTENPRKIVIPSNDGMHVVKIADIIRCESNSNYTIFIIGNNKRLIASRTLKDFDQMLSPYYFERIHKSHLINLNFVKKYVPSDGGYVLMEDGSTIPVANRKKDRLITLLRSV